MVAARPVINPADAPAAVATPDVVPPTASKFTVFVAPIEVITVNAPSHQRRELFK